MNSFSSKIAIVTGGGSGIGKAVAARLVKAGGSVVIGGRDEAKLKQAAADIDPTGTRVRHYAGDIAQPATATGLVNLATEAFGGVDILINNAGVFRPKAFLDVDESEYDWFLDTILKGNADLSVSAVIADAAEAVVAGSSRNGAIVMKRQMSFAEA
uniref:SDR family NAD(P)-dependent oxidoreductase n=1 Tax=Ralstonia solanacearum TaxID=305 RepID=UPI002E1EF393